MAPLPLFAEREVHACRIPEVVLSIVVAAAAISEMLWLIF